MTTNHPFLDQGLTILNTRLQQPSAPPPPEPSLVSHPFITLSQESCAGATSLGQQLVPLLNEQFGEYGRSWVFFDQDLITHALTKHQLPERLSEYLPEDRISEIKSLIGELVGLHPSIWDLEHKISDAIYQLARLGCVILTGRASPIITRSLPGGFHLRLVASMEARVRRMMALKNCDEATAKNSLLNTDQARHRYVQANFQQDPDDPHGYDLVINTDHITSAHAARIIVSALHARFQGAPKHTIPAR